MHALFFSSQHGINFLQQKCSILTFHDNLQQHGAVLHHCNKMPLYTKMHASQRASNRDREGESQRARESWKETDLARERAPERELERAREREPEGEPEGEPVRNWDF